MNRTEDALLRFAVAADPHVEDEGVGAGTGVSKERLEADLQTIGEVEPDAHFVVVLGDLTENGTEAEPNAYSCRSLHRSRRKDKEGRNG